MKDLTAGLHRHGISAEGGRAPGFREFIREIATESLKESISIPVSGKIAEDRPLSCGTSKGAFRDPAAVQYLCREYRPFSRQGCTP